MESISKFVDLPPYVLGKPISVSVERRFIEIQLERGTIRFVKRGLTQFLHTIGFKRSDLSKIKPEDVLSAWDKINENTIFSAFIDNNKYIVYRVTTNYYVPIPHRVLFTHVDNLLKDAGFNSPYVIKKWFTRISATWKLYSMPLKYARPNDYLNIYLYVSNANTGADSIKIFGYGEILKCHNGLAITKGMRVRVMHVKDLNSILERVTKAVQSVLKKIELENVMWAERIEKLQQIELDESELRNWYSKLYDLLPAKYHKYLYRYWSNNLNEFGNTAETVFQTVTALVSRVKNYEVYRRLDKMANELLAIAG